MSKSPAGARMGRRFLRESELISDVLPFSSSTLWRMVRTGEFPEPVRLSKNIVAWRYGDVEEWISGRTSITDRQRKYSRSKA